MQLGHASLPFMGRVDREAGRVGQCEVWLVSEMISPPWPPPRPVPPQEEREEFTHADRTYFAASMTSTWPAAP